MPFEIANYMWILKNIYWIFNQVCIPSVKNPIRALNVKI